ncbi:MAG: hypothetical protein DMF63_13920 [Acidobacteria bacterium]|nr:MAG: hypothetical protein DMF63_13920 [Acidobacteriota bacterium]
MKTTNVTDDLEINSGEAGTIAPVDPRVKYPSYKSFDEFIDVERLRSLDGYIRQRIKRHIVENDDLKFYTGPYTLNEDVAGRPGSRMIYLAHSELPDSYFDLDRPDIWRPTEAAAEFAMLMDFIATLPFKSTGRMLIMYDDAPREVPAHRDHTETEVLHDFIWFRTNRQKPFYVLNPSTGKKKHIEGYSAWFDTVNQFHGSSSTESLAFSVRVDGVFTDEFRNRIPRPPFNAASTPSYWASFDEQGEV